MPPTAGEASNAPLPSTSSANFDPVQDASEENRRLLSREGNVDR